MTRVEVTGSMGNLAEKLDLFVRMDKNEGAKNGINMVWIFVLGFGLLYREWLFVTEVLYYPVKIRHHIFGCILCPLMTES